MLRARSCGRYVGQVDFRFGRRRQLHFGFLGSLFQALEGHCIFAQVEAFVFTGERLGQEVDNYLVEVVATKVGVAVGAQHLEYAVAELQNGDVERTAAKVIHGNLLVLMFLVEAVRQCGRGGFVDDALHVEAGNGAGFFGGLALSIVEVSRHRNNGFRHGLAEVVFGGLLHLLQYHRRNLLRRILPVANLHCYRVVGTAHQLVRYVFGFLSHFAEAAAHEALDALQRIGGVGNCLALSRVTYLPLALAVVEERHDRWRGAAAFAVRNHHRLVAFHNGYARVGGAEVNTNYFAHQNGYRLGVEMSGWRMRIARVG